MKIKRLIIRLAQALVALVLLLALSTITSAFASTSCPSLLELVALAGTCGNGSVLELLGASAIGDGGESA